MISVKVKIWALNSFINTKVGMFIRLCWLDQTRSIRHFVSNMLVRKVVYLIFTVDILMHGLTLMSSGYLWEVVGFLLITFLGLTWRITLLLWWSHYAHKLSWCLVMKLGFLNICNFFSFIHLLPFTNLIRVAGVLERIPATIGRESRCRSQGEIANIPVGNLDSPMNPLNTWHWTVGRSWRKDVNFIQF